MKIKLDNVQNTAEAWNLEGVQHQRLKCAGVGCVILGGQVLVIFCLLKAFLFQMSFIKEERISLVFGE